MRKQWLVLLIAVLASAILWGCGSSGGSGGSEVTGETSVAGANNVGNCTVCHTLDVHTFLDGIAGVNTDANGLGSAITHDCEACHGGGQYHHGDGPIPYPSPNLARCDNCHDQTTKVLESAHNFNTDGAAADAIVLADEHYVEGVCIRCHTAEGFMALKDITGDEATIEAAFDIAEAAGDVPDSFDVEGNSIIHNPVCGACHNPLTMGMIDAPAWAPNGSTSEQLAICTACHNYKEDGAVADIFATGEAYDITTDLGADGELGGGDDTVVATAATAQIGHHDTSWFRTIATTHYDNPDSTGVIEGYVIRENGDSPCFDCHGHELLTGTGDADPANPETLTIHTQWATSGHAGGLLSEVVDAVAAIDCENIDGAGTDSASLSRGHCYEEVHAALGAGSTAGPFAGHYDFSSGTVFGRVCERCHTSTGASNYLSEPDNYVPADNDLSHVDSGQHEMIYCWACHSNAESGELRDPGSLTLLTIFGANMQYDGADVVIPDQGSSNVCLGCHGGGDNMEAARSTRFAGHHVQAGGSLFNEAIHMGSEYPGQDYTNGYYHHPDIGSDDGSGPCVGCHMASDDTKNHTFSIVDEAGNVNPQTKTFCDTCHTPGASYEITTAKLDEERTGYQEAGEILEEVLANAIGYTNDWATDFSAEDVTDPVAVPDDVYYAYQNRLYIEDEPGGYAHNRIYLKRLVFDSLKMMMDGTLVGDITFTAAMIADYPEGCLWLGMDETTGIASRP